MKRIRYAVEYKDSPGKSAGIAAFAKDAEWWETQETASLYSARDIEKRLHDAGFVARVIERTTTERYLGKHN